MTATAVEEKPIDATGVLTNYQLIDAAKALIEAGEPTDHLVDRAIDRAWAQKKLAVLHERNRQFDILADAMARQELAGRMREAADAAEARLSLQIREAEERVRQLRQDFAAEVEAVREDAKRLRCTTCDASGEAYDREFMRETCDAKLEERRYKNTGNNPDESHRIEMEEMSDWRNIGVEQTGKDAIQKRIADGQPIQHTTPQLHSFGSRERRYSAPRDRTVRTNPYELPSTG